MKFLKELYPKIALLKSAYSFTDRAYIHLDADDEYYYATVTPKPEKEPVTEEEFMNEMLCQAVRHEVYRQTKTLRELLVARAVASSVVQTDDRVDLHDDAAFRNDALAAEILTDWFEADESA